MSKISSLIKKTTRKKCTAVIVAAGSSLRMGKDKLTMPIGGIPVLVRTLQAFEKSEYIDEIIVVVRADRLEEMAKVCEEANIQKLKELVSGGKTRIESALAGVSEADPSSGIICIHDGARPFVTDKIIEDTVRAAVLYKSAAPAVAVTDTVRIKGDDGALITPERSKVFAMQTPQAFDADIIKAALTDAVSKGMNYTDDCAACESMGVRTHLCEGDRENIKLTSPMDAAVAEYIVSARVKRS